MTFSIRTQKNKKIIMAGLDKKTAFMNSVKPEAGGFKVEVIPDLKAV